jgi:hypothetical protein
MVKVARISETSVIFYQSTLRYNPEGSHFSSHWILRLLSRHSPGEKEKIKEIVAEVRT